jgi:hypothetical protein
MSDDDEKTDDKRGAIARLEELLDLKDRELEKAQHEVRELVSKLDCSESGWSLPVDVPETGLREGLPVPRLEMVYEPHGWEGEEWAVTLVWYRLVHRHFLGHCVGITLGQTRSTGGGMRSPVASVGKFREGIDLPFRDGAHFRHDAPHLKLPAFVLVPSEGYIEQLKSKPGDELSIPEKEKRR